ncbi:MAG: toll/interleukin-1 receptor domain-containing protein [Ginsengibacter sp.]
MGIYVRTFEQIYRAIESVSDSGRLFAFILLDESAGNEPVFNMVNANKDFIDALSASSKIFTFIPFSQWTDFDQKPGFLVFERPYSVNLEEKEFLSTIEKKKFSVNLSLAIAEKFGIKPRELPGIVFFTQFPDAKPVEPVYYPIGEENIAEQKQFERMIKELYSVVQDAWDIAGSAHEVLSALKTSFAGQSPVKLLPVPSKNARTIFEEAASAAVIQEKPTGDFPFLSAAEKENIQVFISYAREDEKFAKFLFKRFQGAGYNPWIDSLNIRPGQLWEKQIEKGLRESMFFVACLSRESVGKRGYLQKEFNFALEKWKEHLEDDIYIIPIRLDDCEIPISMNKFQWVDFFTKPALGTHDYPYASEGAWIKIMGSVTEGVRKRNSGGS